MHAKEKKAVFNPVIRETPDQVAKRRRLGNESYIVKPPDNLSTFRDHLDIAELYKTPLILNR